MRCRFCNNKLSIVFADLAKQPLSDGFLSKEDLNKVEKFYPLKIYFCQKCKLVQLDEHESPDIVFNDKYAYFSSYSKTWLNHCKDYVDMIVKRLKLDNNSFVYEIASNDGYLLQNFIKKKIPCIGIEPTKNTADVARKKGIDVIVEFFSENLAKTLKKADLIIGNNVIAHTPYINDFVKGLKIALKTNGTITLEFPHLLELIKNIQFDTIYQEHYSYFSLTAINTIFAHHNLKIYDAQRLSTHGGSLRIYATHTENNELKILDNVDEILKIEKEFGMLDDKIYKNFQHKIDKIKFDTLLFLISQKINNKKIIGFGAAAKANTFLNHLGIKNDILDFIVDDTPYKQNKFCPGNHIRVATFGEIEFAKPDYILILPWNLKDEIIKKLEFTRKWGCKFITAIPSLQIY